jgi:hypothetical protein
MTAILQALNDLVQSGWAGLGPIFSAVWSKGVIATLAAVAVVGWAYQEARR